MSNVSSLGSSANLVSSGSHVSNQNVQQTRQEMPSVALAKVATSEQTVHSVVQVSNTAPTADELKKIVNKMQNKISQTSPELKFSIDQDCGKTVVKVTNQQTAEVIWQFPSEAALQISKVMDRFQKGLLLSRKV